MRIPCHCGRHSSLLPCLASHSAKGSLEETAGRGRRLECREECFALLEAQEKEEEKTHYVGKKARGKETNWGGGDQF